MHAASGNSTSDSRLTHKVSAARELHQSSALTIPLSHRTIFGTDFIKEKLQRIPQAKLERRKKIRASMRVKQNIRAAYVHVLADALTSVLAVGALLSAWHFGIVWIDPLVGIVGAGVIVSWAVSLIRSSGAVDKAQSKPLSATNMPCFFKALRIAWNGGEKPLMS